MSNEEDNLMREFLKSCTFQVEDGDETFFKFWKKDDGLNIRSCLECDASEFKSVEDGAWIIYTTTKHKKWVLDNCEKGNFNPKCSLCDKWFWSKKTNQHKEL